MFFDQIERNGAWTEPELSHQSPTIGRRGRRSVAETGAAEMEDFAGGERREEKVRRL